MITVYKPEEYKFIEFSTKEECLEWKETFKKLNSNIPNKDSLILMREKTYYNLKIMPTSMENLFRCDYMCIKNEEALKWVQNVFVLYEEDYDYNYPDSLGVFRQSDFSDIRVRNITGILTMYDICNLNKQEINKWISSRHNTKKTKE